MKNQDATTAPAQRIAIVDVLRGFALQGIFLTHLFLLNLEQRTTPMLRSDRILEFVFRGFLFGRFYTIFSFLFGLSFAIQLQSADRKQVPFSGRFVWRLAILFCIGYGHFLFFDDDILQAYALLGTGLILIRKLPVKQLLYICAALFLLLPVLNVTAPALKHIYLGHNAWNSAGSFCRKLSFYVYNKQLVIIALMFVLGLIAGKQKLFSGQHPIFSLRSYLIGLTTAVVTSIAFAELALHDDSTVNHRVLSGFLSPVQQFSISYCYVATLVRVYRGVLRNGLGVLARVGKIGLTVYVTQSLLLILATPLIIQTNLIGVVGITVVLSGLQVVFANWWVKHYQYGPLEWLWRSLTYLTIQPIRKQAELVNKPTLIEA